MHQAASMMVLASQPLSHYPTVRSLEIPSTRLRCFCRFHVCVCWTRSRPQFVSLTICTRDSFRLCTRSHLNRDFSLLAGRVAAAAAASACADMSLPAFPPRCQTIGLHRLAAVKRRRL